MYYEALCTYGYADTDIVESRLRTAGARARSCSHSQLSRLKAIFDYLICVAHSLLVDQFSARFVHNIFCAEKVYLIRVIYVENMEQYIVWCECLTRARIKT